MKKVLRLLPFFVLAVALFSACSEDDPNVAPEFGVNTGVVLQNGESVIISNEMLKVSDIDTKSEELIYTVTKATENGTLVHLDDETVDVTSFSQKDIDEKLIKYIHDGSKTLSDLFNFSITDGETALEGTFNISIGEKQIAYTYVLNEGNENGSVAYINTNNQIVNNYYNSANSLPLGKFPQSMAANDTHVFIAVTTSTGAGYIEVVDKTTFKQVKSITGFSYPREIALIDGKAYVTNGTGADANYQKQNSEIYPIDLSDFKVGNKITVGAGPEKMVVSNGKLYVANSGGWSNDDNTVTVIDTANDQVIETITVKSCPKDMEVDVNGDVWVFCAGVPSWSAVQGSGPAICKIETASGNVTSWDIPSVTSGGIKNIAITKGKDAIYYIADAVYKMSINATALPTDKFIDNIYYGIDVHPVKDELWLCQNSVYGASGKMVSVYDKEGKMITEYETGVVPNSTVFVY